MDATCIFQAASDQLLAESCQWVPPAPRDRPAPIDLYPQPQHMPDDPTWTAPVHAFSVGA